MTDINIQTPDQVYDTIIIGTGPAGVAAAIYAIRREMKVLLIGKELGGQMTLSNEIENYPGIVSIKNFDLIDKFSEHLKSAGVVPKISEVKVIEKTPAGTFKLYTTKDSFETKTIIVAMGLIPQRLAIPGEERLAGKGVSYCANCDGPLFKNKVVAVVGGGNSALDAAEVLSKIASKVYLIHRRDKFRAFEELVDQVKARPNIEILASSEIKDIIGENKLEKLNIINNQTGESKEISLNGLFIEIGRIARTDLVGELVKRDERNQIITDEKCRTSHDGIFAAGDVTQTEFKQITVALGQGTIAALAAYQYLQFKQGKPVKRVADYSR
jgi:thioredoxin-disulfide reductase